MKKLFFSLLTILSILAINTEKSYGAKNSDWMTYNPLSQKNEWNKTEEEISLTRKEPRPEDKEDEEDFDNLLKLINSLDLADFSDDEYTPLDQKKKIKIPTNTINEIYSILPYFLTCVKKLQAALPTNVERLNNHTAQVARKITTKSHQICLNLISDLEKITNSTCPHSYENTGKEPALFVWTRLLGNFLQNKPYEEFGEWIKKFPTEKRGAVLLRLLIHDCYLEKNDDSLHGFSPLCSFSNNLKSLQLFALELNAIINEQSSVENKIFETHAKKIGELLDYFKTQKSPLSQDPSHEE